MPIDEYFQLITTKSQRVGSTNQAEQIADHSQDIINMLTMWGAFNRYKSQCGYRGINASFSVLYPKKNRLFIEDDINMIESVLLTLKNSKIKKQQQQYRIIEVYYKGIDLVNDGYDWSQKLTIRDIATLLDIPKSTVANRKKEAENYICTEMMKVKVSFS